MDIVAKVDEVSGEFTWFTRGVGVVPGVGDVIAETRILGASTQTYVYVQNHRGDTVALVGSSGLEVGRYEYDAWGNVTTQRGLSAWLTFSGKHYDEEARLYYYGYRWYDPEARRWTQEDPLLKMGNLLRWTLLAYGKARIASPPIHRARRAGNSSWTEQVTPSIDLYNFVGMSPLMRFDFYGLQDQSEKKEDRCGSNGTEWVPDVWPPWVPEWWPVKFDFSGACAEHDRCYGKCGNPKTDCDEQFRKDLFKVCHSQWPLMKEPCYALAMAYYTAVDTLGCRAYEKAQKEDCEKLRKAQDCGASEKTVQWNGCNTK